jgi:hypothetical protein
MKRQSTLIAITAATAGSLLSAAAHATITDSLTGPASSDGDVTVVQGALTAGPVDGFDAPNPYLSSNSSRGFGNSRFGANVSVSSYTGAPAPGVTEAVNSFSSTATVFGTTQNVLTATTYGITSGPSQSANVYGYVVAAGNLVRNTSRSGGDFNGTYFLNTFSQDLYNSGTQTFYIGPVPVSVGVTINARASQSVTGHVWVDGIEGYLSQGAAVSATAFGGLGPSWANTGLKVKNLQLLNLNLTLNPKARYNSFFPGIPNATCISTFTLGTKDSLYLQELKGEIDLYAKASLLLIHVDDDYQIASWPGFTWSFPLIDFAPRIKNYGVCFTITPAPQIQGIVIG